MWNFSIIQTDKNLTIVTLLGVFGISLILAIGAIIYKFKYVDDQVIANDTKSQNTIDDLNKSLTSLLGNNWQYIILFFIFVLFFILLLLYFLSLKDISISISSDQKTIIEMIYVVLILTTIIIFSLSVSIMYDISKDKDNIPKNTEEYENVNYVGKAIMFGLIISLSLVTFIGYFIYKYVLGY